MYKPIRMAIPGSANSKQQRPQDMNPQEFFRYLQEMEFPACVKEALVCLVNNTLNKHGHPRTKIQLLIDVSTDFVFHVVDQRDGKRRDPTAIQELVVINELRNFFCQPTMSGDPATRNAIFMTLFQNISEPKRVALLAKLTSLAISLKLLPVLDSTAVLLVQMGNCSEVAEKVMSHLVKEFVYLTPEPGLASLKELRELSPFFVGYFIGALGPLYSGERRIKRVRRESLDFGDELPPTALMDVLNFWIRGTPQTPFLPVVTPLQNQLPPGCIPMPATSPMASMFRWSIVAPLVIEGTPSAEESRKVFSEWDYHCRDCLDLAWSQVRTDEVLSSKEVLRIVNDLVDCVDFYGCPRDSEAVELSLLRLSTLVKSCLSKGYFASSKEDLILGLKKLPPHPVLSLTSV